MSSFFDSVLDNWILWLLAIEAVLVGAGFAILWGRQKINSLKVLFGGWLAATLFLFAITLIFVLVIVPIVVVLIAALLVVLLFVLVASLFRRRSTS